MLGTNPSRTSILGILNVTPDSFSDGSNGNPCVETSVERALQMLKDGADAIDIGGESTRPGFEPVDAETEKTRVLPVIKELRRRAPGAIISVDTRKWEVAEEGLRYGANLVNAYGGLAPSDMARVVEKYRCGVICYHVDSTKRLTDRVAFRQVKRFFREQEEIVTNMRHRIDGLILDPGFGWKTLSQTVHLLERLEELRDKCSRTILVGVSRKQHLGFLLQRELKLETTPGLQERHEAGLAETAIAVLRGANVIRTHDAAVTRKFLALFDFYRSQRR